MVYESRVGDVFTLGTTSWRIEDITRDRVLVSPAPGRARAAALLEGRPAGPPARTGPRGGRVPARGRRAARGDGPASGCAPPVSTPGPPTTCCPIWTNSAQACGHVPDDRTIVVERFRDELGDWRVVVHSPFGAQVHAPWALALGARLSERYGMDAQVMHADDGIVLRLPDADLMGLDLLDQDPLPGRARSTTAEQAPVGRGGRRLRQGRGRPDSSPTRSAARRCSRPGSASARPAPCCCRAATRASAPRCGSSASAPPNCSRWPREFGDRSRSCWRRSASASRTSSTCRGSIELMGDLSHARCALVEVDHPGAVARSPGRCCFGYVAAVPLRGGLPARRAPGRRAVPRLAAAGRAAGPGRAARAARRRRAGGDWSVNSSG